MGHNFTYDGCAEIKDSYKISGKMLTTPIGAFDVQSISSVEREDTSESWFSWVKFFIVIAMIFSLLSGVIPLFGILLVCCSLFNIHKRVVIISNNKRYVIYDAAFNSAYKHYLLMTKKDFPVDWFLEKEIYGYVLSEIEKIRQSDFCDDNRGLQQI
ncbi:MAG: hypothetical protein WCP60_11095 [bacterium]